MDKREINSNKDEITEVAEVVSISSVGGLYVRCSEIAEQMFYTHLSGSSPDYDQQVSEYEKGDSVLLTYEKFGTSSTLTNEYTLVSVELE